MDYDKKDLDAYTDKVKVNIINKNNKPKETANTHLRQNEEMGKITNRDTKYINDNPESHTLDESIKINESITDSENVRNLIDRDRRLDQK